MNARIASLSLFVAVVSLGIGLSVGHMRELGAANVDVPSLVAASESASSPAASAAPADDGGFLGLLMTGKYLPAVGAFLILFVAGLRSVLALRVAWFATKVGGYALGFGSAVLLYLGAAWQSGAGITVGLFAAALGAGWAAAGGWEHLMDLVDWMRSKKPTVQPTAIVLVTTLACLIMGGAVVQACGPVKQAGQAIIDCLL